MSPTLVSLMEPAFVLMYVVVCVVRSGTWSKELFQTKA